MGWIGKRLRVGDEPGENELEALQVHSMEWGLFSLLLCIFLP